MSQLPATDRPPAGLRERKKARTRAAIQDEALRLFRQQGYAATTVEQIAAAADISPSTFFRYFPTKEAVVLYDALDPAAIEAFRAQPASSSTIRALRDAMRATLAGLTPEQAAAQRERDALIRSVPELRARMLDEFGRTVQLLAELIAERVGRRADDPEVRTLAGAVVGVAIAAWFASPEYESLPEFVALVDEGLARLESGLRL
jgi:AcrR family transcriptional regulator